MTARYPLAGRARKGTNTIVTRQAPPTPMRAARSPCSSRSSVPTDLSELMFVFLSLVVTRRVVRLIDTPITLGVTISLVPYYLDLYRYRTHYSYFASRCSGYLVNHEPGHGVPVQSYRVHVARRYSRFSRNHQQGCARPLLHHPESVVVCAPLRLRFHNFIKSNCLSESEQIEASMTD